MCAVHQVVATNESSWLTSSGESPSRANATSTRSNNPGESLVGLDPLAPVEGKVWRGVHRHDPCAQSPLSQPAGQVELRDVAAEEVLQLDRRDHHVHASGRLVRDRQLDRLDERGELANEGVSRSRGRAAGSVERRQAGVVRGLDRLAGRRTLPAQWENPLKVAPDDAPGAGCAPRRRSRAGPAGRARGAPPATATMSPIARCGAVARGRGGNAGRAVPRNASAGPGRGAEGVAGRRSRRPATRSPPRGADPRTSRRSLGPTPVAGSAEAAA